MNTRLLYLGLAPLLAATLTACTQDREPRPEPSSVPEPASTEAPADELEARVARMGAIGFSYDGVFSPAGDRIAFISNASGVPNVWLAGPDGGDLHQVTRFDDAVSDVQWSPVAETLAIQVMPGGGLNTQIYLVSADGEDARMITRGGRINNWLGQWSDDGRYLTYSSNAESTDGMDCWLYDNETNESRLIVMNGGVGQCIVSPDNTRAVVWRMISRGDSNLYLVDIASGDEQNLTPHAGVALADGPAFLDDDTVLFKTNVDRERMALARVKITDGVAGPLEIIAGRDDAELADIEKLADGRLALNWNAAGQSEITWFELDSRTMTPGPALPAELAGSLTASHDGTQLLITLSGSVVPTDVWRLDPAPGEFTRISDTPHEGVDLATLVRPELRTFTAHDGLELTGWLYRPPGQTEPGPMVLSFHGGPEGQERPGFRGTYQALLSRGIAVFGPNVRGSDGFGKTFVNLDNGALRANGVRDIESTVNYVVEQGLADPDRIGIMGGSYGGYMVMAGLTEFPDLFAAGADLYGIVNFETFFANTEPWMAAVSTVEYGDPVTEKELLQQLSPIHKLDRVTAPTIVLHGANDTNVPVVEAEQVVENLRSRDVPVRYVLFPDEGHGWRKVQNRITSDVEIVRWFEAHL